MPEDLKKMAISDRRLLKAKKQKAAKAVRDRVRKYREIKKGEDKKKNLLEIKPTKLIIPPGFSEEQTEEATKLVAEGNIDYPPSIEEAYSEDSDSPPLEPLIEQGPDGPNHLD